MDLIHFFISSKKKKNLLLFIFIRQTLSLHFAVYHYKFSFLIRFYSLLISKYVIHDLKGTKIGLFRFNSGNQSEIPKEVNFVIT